LTGLCPAHQDIEEALVTYKADPATMQVIRYGLEAIADDMGHNLMRMGRTTIVKEIMDINCAILDALGLWTPT
jgi:N-methylhydantoinase B/oxoprolinase/acetone carboxylase alpha subunit